MIHPIGTPIEGTLDFAGAVTSPSGVLYVNDAASATAVIVNVVDSNFVTFSVSTTSPTLVTGDRLQVRVPATVDAETVTLRSAVRVLGDTSTKQDIADAAHGTTPTGETETLGSELDTLVSRTTGGVSVTIQSPVTEDGSLQPLKQGDSYIDADGRALSWTLSNHGFDLTDATAKLGLKSQVNGTTVVIDATITEDGANANFKTQLPSATTQLLPVGGLQWELQITLVEGSTTRPVTPLEGETTVKPQIVQ